MISDTVSLRSQYGAWGIFIAGKVFFGHGRSLLESPTFSWAVKNYLSVLHGDKLIHIAEQNNSAKVLTISVLTIFLFSLFIQDLARLSDVLQKIKYSFRPGIMFFSDILYNIHIHTFLKRDILMFMSDTQPFVSYKCIEK